MEPEKNLHAAIPSALLIEATRAAQDGNISFDELVADAMERRLREIRRARLYAYAEERARSSGITADRDVETLVYQYRQETSAVRR